MVVTSNPQQVSQTHYGTEITIGTTHIGIHRLRFILVPADDEIHIDQLTPGQPATHLGAVIDVASGKATVDLIPEHEPEFDRHRERLRAEAMTGYYTQRREDRDAQEHPCLAWER